MINYNFLIKQLKNRLYFLTSKTISILSYGVDVKEIENNLKECSRIQKIVGYLRERRARVWQD